MTLEELEKQLTKAIAPIYVVVGPSAYIRVRANHLIVTAALGGGNADFNMDRFQGGQDSLANLSRIARTYPMMAARRVILIRAAHNLKTEDLQMLGALAQERLDTCTIVVEGEKLDKRSALAKVAKADGSLVEFDKLKPNQIAAWASRMARERGKKLADDAASFLAAQLGDDLHRIESEVEKSALFAEAKATIDLADVQAVMVALKTESVFDLTDAIGEKNRAKAFFFLDGMLETGQHPIRVHSAIAGHVRKLLLVKELHEKQMSADDIARELGAHPYVVQKMQAQARHYRRDDLLRALVNLSRTDFDLKNSRANDRIILERMILDLCGNHAEARE